LKVIAKKPASGNTLPTNIHSAKNFVFIQQDKKGVDVLAGNLTGKFEKRLIF